MYIATNNVDIKKKPELQVVLSLYVHFLISVCGFSKCCLG